MEGSDLDNIDSSKVGNVEIFHNFLFSYIKLLTNKKE